MYIDSYKHVIHKLWIELCKLIIVIHNYSVLNNKLYVDNLIIFFTRYR